MGFYVKCCNATPLASLSIIPKSWIAPLPLARMSGAAAAAAQHIDMRQCRICLGGPDEELGRLIKPCLCKGSIKVRLEPTWHTMIAHV
jgi:hypothetical protein